MTRMSITDVFHFKDGRSVLTVVPEGDPKLIESGTYDLMKEGVSFQRVRVENEMMTRGLRGNRQRSVSTVERVDLPSGRPNEEVTLVPRR